MTFRRHAAAVLALLAGVAGCTSVEPGVEVEVSMLHHMGSEPLFADVRIGAGVERGIITDRGYGVTLSRMRLVIGRLELVPCEAETSEQAAFDAASMRSVERAARGLLALLNPVSVAHAHGTVSPLALNEPHVLDLMAEDRAAFAYGTLRPPPDRYCALEVHVEPADLDAVGVASSEDALVGRSLWFEGSYLDATEVAARPLSLGSALDERLRVPFHDEAGAPRELHVSANARSAEIRIELSYGRLLDSIDLRHDDPTQQQYQAIRNALDSLRVIIVE